MYVYVHKERYLSWDACKKDKFTWFMSKWSKEFLFVRFFTVFWVLNLFEGLNTENHFSNFQNDDFVAMDTDSSDLKLVLETSTDDVQNSASPIPARSEKEKPTAIDNSKDVPKEDKKDSNSDNKTEEIYQSAKEKSRSVAKKATPGATAPTGLTIKSASGNPAPRRISFITLSSNKSWWND